MIDEFVGAKYLLVSFSALKNILPVIEQFADVDKIIVTKVDENRSLEPAEIIAYLAEHDIKITTQIIDSPNQAVRESVAKLKKDDLLVITGSVYLAGLASRMLVI